MLKKNITILFIGAGSPTFTTNIIFDISRHPALDKSIIILFDKDKQKLNQIYKTSKFFIKNIHSKIKIVKSYNLKNAIIKSNFIINSAFNTGWVKVEKIRKEILKKTGIKQPIEAQAYFDQLNFLLNIAKMIEKHNPKAYLFQCANPISEGGTLIVNLTKVKFIGVCHGIKKFDQVLGILGIDQKNVDFTVAGINHNIWLIDFNYRNRDAYPRLKEWIKIQYNKFRPYIFNYLNSKDYQLSPCAFDMFKKYGLFPVGDTTRASQPHFYKYHKSIDIEKKYFGNTLGRDSSIGFNEKMQERKDDLQYNFPNQKSEWQVAEIINSIITNTPTIQVICVKNKNYIKQLSNKIIVELPMVIKGKSIKPVKKIKYSKEFVKFALLPHQKQIENHVNAFINKRKKFLLKQILSNECVKNIKTAEVIYNIWEKYIPEMKKYYK